MGEKRAHHAETAVDDADGFRLGADDADLCSKSEVGECSHVPGPIDSSMFTAFPWTPRRPGSPTRCLDMAPLRCLVM